jgi:hypothetical protein
LRSAIVTSTTPIPAAPPVEKLLGKNLNMKTPCED